MSLETCDDKESWRRNDGYHHKCNLSSYNVCFLPYQKDTFELYKRKMITLDYNLQYLTTSLQMIIILKVENFGIFLISLSVPEWYMKYDFHECAKIYKILRYIRHVPKNCSCLMWCILCECIKFQQQEERRKLMGFCSIFTMLLLNRLGLNVCSCYAFVLTYI